MRSLIQHMLLLGNQAAAAAPFTPADITGLVLWLDAQDTATLYQDSAKTTPAAADNDPIGAWADKSGNGKDATQASTANKPTLKLAVQNSRPVLRFDGGDYLSADALASGFAISNPPITMGIVANVSNTESYRALVLFGADGSSYSLIGLYASNTAKWRCVARGPTVREIVGGTANATYSIVVGRSSGTVGQLFVNGAQVGADTDFTANPALTNFKVGVWKYSASQDYHMGDIAEIVIYNRALSMAERGALESYLAAKWGIALA